LTQPPARSAAASNFHGRRKGRRLRPGRQALLTSLLPRLRIELPCDGGALAPLALFEGAMRAVWLEVGFGAGEHLVAQAEAHPDVGFIGCEPFVNGVASALSEIEKRRLDNVRICDDDARLVLNALTEQSVGKVFVLFPDPWPKTRHHDRRFIGPGTVEALARILKDAGELGFASDHMDYVRWTLDHLGATAGSRGRPGSRRTGAAGPKTGFPPATKRRRWPGARRASTSGSSAGGAATAPAGKRKSLVPKGTRAI
jgi:tRNA (guanine-N7-)-methyltransferase